MTSTEISPYQSPSIYVGDLHPSVTEAILFEIFKAVGPVASIRVCRDTVTRRSLGYAYVNFHNVVDAQRAKDALNYTTIKGKQIRIMWCVRDPSKRKSGSGNVFIKNLDKSIDNKALYDTFINFGSILSCIVATDDKGNSKGYGFVHYETEEAAKQAINKVNGMMLNGKVVYVGEFEPRSVRKPSVDPNQYTNLYVKHFPDGWGSEELEKSFAQYGEIQSAVVVTGTEGEAKGFGYVNFADHESAAKAVEDMHQKKKFTEDCKHEAYVQRMMTKSERERFLRSKHEERVQKYQGINLYVKNLDDSVTEEKLREVFGAFGDITSCVIMKDENNASKGFGFVCFTTPEEASKAVTQMHSTMLAGKPLYVALAERKERRRTRLQAQYASRHTFGSRMAQNPGMGAPVYGPVFYPPQQRVVYGQPVMRPRWPSGSRQGSYARGPVQQRGNYVVPVQQRGTGGAQRGGKGGPAAGANNGFRGGPQGQGQGQGGAPAGRGKGGEGFGMAPAVNLSVLASASPEEQKQTIGESLFPKIRAIEPDNCSKLTGMFLESLDIPELLRLLESPEALALRVDEGLAVLEEHARAANGAAEGQGGETQD